MRKMASVKRIDSISPIEGADRIECAAIGGFDVVVQKNEFKPGDLCIYCETDSILPKENENFAFLEGKRIKIKRLRGIYSYGIAFPMRILENSEQYNEDDDLTEVLGVTKWEPEEYGTGQKDHKSGSGLTFPSWIPKTDETRFQSVMGVLQEFEGTPCIITEKLDGSSTTHFLDAEGKYHVCSRKREIDDPTEIFWKAGITNNIPELLKNLPEGAVVQGELIGPGIQKNRYNLTDYQIRMFNLRVNGKFVDQDQAIDMLEAAGFKTVPVLNDNWELSADKDTLLNMSIGTSVLNPKQQREGLVIRSKVNKIVQGNIAGSFVDGRFSFKIINPKYELGLAKE